MTANPWSKWLPLCSMVHGHVDGSEPPPSALPPLPPHEQIHAAPATMKASCRKRRRCRNPIRAPGTSRARVSHLSKCSGPWPANAAAVAVMVTTVFVPPAASCRLPGSKNRRVRWSGARKTDVAGETARGYNGHGDGGRSLRLHRDRPGAQISTDVAHVER